MSTTNDLNTEKKPARRNALPLSLRSSDWVSMLTACLVALGLVSLLYAGFGSLQAEPEPMDATEVRQVQELPIGDLEAMDPAQLSEMLAELDRAAEANTAPSAVIESEIARVQGVWEAKWYEN